MLLAGFDSSCLEMRSLLPQLDSAGAEAWAVDLVGWGFTDAGFASQPNTLLGPDQKREHLFAFWQSQVGRHGLLYIAPGILHASKG